MRSTIYNNSLSLSLSLSLSAVHTVLQDLLPPSSYYRFNPTLSEFIALDNCAPSKLQSITDDTHRYAELNEDLLVKASQSLKEEKTFRQKLQAYFGWQ